MKKELFFGTILALLALGIAGYFTVQYQDKTSTLPLPNISNSPGAATNNSSSDSGQISLTEATVAGHNSPADCWIIISGKVYAVSQYLNVHPGGASAIAPYCGRDATTAFATKGGRGSHSANAQNLLTSFLLGDLGTQASAGSVQSVEQAPPPASVADDDDENEGEDD